jgi:hypothetical protein
MKKFPAILQGTLAPNPESNENTEQQSPVSMSRLENEEKG